MMNYYEILNLKYPYTNNCVELDESIKKLSDELNELKKDNISPFFIGKSYQERIDIYNWKLSKLQELFINKDCRNKIETKRQEDISKIFVATSVKQETQVLGKSNAKQYILIGSAAFVLLISIYIITKK